MTLSLYTLEPPSGRCLLLIHQLHLVASLTHSECVQVALALFENQHLPGNPASIEIADGNSIEGLQAICSDLGIEVGSSELEGTKMGRLVQDHGSA